LREVNKITPLPDTNTKQTFSQLLPPFPEHNRNDHEDVDEEEYGRGACHGHHDDPGKLSLGQEPVQGLASCGTRIYEKLINSPVKRFLACRRTQHPMSTTLRSTRAVPTAATTATNQPPAAAPLLPAACSAGGTSSAPSPKHQNMHTAG